MAAHIQNWKLIDVRQRSKTVKRLVYTRIVLWPKVTKNPIKVVISRDPEGKEKDDFFFTTDLEMTACEVLECYGDRWADWKMRLRMSSNRWVFSSRKPTKVKVPNERQPWDFGCIRWFGSGIFKENRAIEPSW